MKGPAIALALVLAARVAGAASFVLDEPSIGQAEALGRRSVASEAAFDGEWRVANARGESVSVMTPFHRVVLAARHAAFRSDPLKPADRDRALRADRERLVFWATLRGSRTDFTRFYVPRLLVSGSGGEREVEPTFVQNERTAARHEGGGFVARCVYGFPTKDLDGTARLTLVIRDADGKEVGRFPVNLAAMR